MLSTSRIDAVEVKVAGPVKSCQLLVQILYSGRHARDRFSSHRRAEPPFRRLPGAVAGLGTTLRTASADPLRGRAAAVHARGSRPGVAAAEAARLAAAEKAPAAEAAFSPEAARDALSAAFAAFDEAGAQSVLDSVFAATTLDSALSAVLVPYLRELGARWERGDASVAEEHFASGVLRGRLLGLARGWGRGVGPRVLLACAPGEQHDLGLIAFGLALRARGWRVGYLGPDMPVDSVEIAARAFGPAFVVISSVSAERLQDHATELKRIAENHGLALGGRGAADVDLGVDVPVLSGDPVEEADRLTELARS
jgi:MerR family transcriptional regulator, light-induced transcriptional regulator